MELSTNGGGTERIRAVVSYAAPLTWMDNDHDPRTQHILNLIGEHCDGGSYCEATFDKDRKVLVWTIYDYQ